jgi:hypothetical protein
MAEITAPTITIDGVISAPGEPVSFAALGCDCIEIATRHGYTVDGDAACGKHGATTVTGVLETWVF